MTRNNEIPQTVVAKWNQLHERVSRDDYDPFRWLLPLVDTVITRQIMPLYGLFPFTSHAYLNFSRTTLYPYASRECPHVVAIAEGIYRVLGTHYKMVVNTYNAPDGKQTKFRFGKNVVLGEAGVEGAIQLILDALPPDIACAIDSNGDELYRAERIGLVEERDRQLRKAVCEGRREAVRDALDAGAAVNTADEDGFTHLMIAILLHHTDIVRLLLAEGASVHKKNNGGETALSLGRFEGDRHPEILHMVERASQDV